MELRILHKANPLSGIAPGPLPQSMTVSNRVSRPPEHAPVADSSAFSNLTVVPELDKGRCVAALMLYPTWPRPREQ